MGRDREGVGLLSRVLLALVAFSSLLLGVWASVAAESLRARDFGGLDLGWR